MIFNQRISPSVEDVLMMKHSFIANEGYDPVILHYNPKLIDISYLMDEVTDFAKYTNIDPTQKLTILGMEFIPKSDMSDQLELL